MIPKRLKDLDKDLVVPSIVSEYEWKNMPQEERRRVVEQAISLVKNSEIEER